MQTWPINCVRAASPKPRSACRRSSLLTDDPQASVTSAIVVLVSRCSVHTETLIVVFFRSAVTE